MAASSRPGRRLGGNSVPVLPATYTRCLTGQLTDLKRRIEAEGDLPTAD
ncbi:hypothetical protein [Streptomyces sp. NPDC054786]